MAQSDIQVTVGSGTRLRTATKTISGQTRHEQYHHLAQPDEASYTLSAGSISAATANSHVMQLMAGSTLNVYVTRIRVFQLALATTAAQGRLFVYRLSTAGTGGTAVTPNPYDTTDSASGATGMTLPTVKGTEGVPFWQSASQFMQTVPAGPAQQSLLLDVDFDRLRTKGLRIPAGTANGIAIKCIDAIAAATVQVDIDFIEASY